MFSLPDAVILSQGPLQLRWYGLFAALAMLTGYAMMHFRRKNTHLLADDLNTLLLTCVVAGLVGARLEYVRRFWGESFAGDPLAVFRVWEGGLVFQGGFVVALLAVWALCRWRHWREGEIADFLAPALPTAHAVARLGCLFNGCCFGIPWSHWGAVLYPTRGNDVMHTQKLLGLLPEDATAPLPVLPVQALEALWCLAVAGVILLAEKRGWLKGRRFFLYLFGYSIGRFLLEFLRGDYHQNGGLTPAQWTTALLILPATLAVFLWCTWKNARTKPGSPKP